MAVSWLLSLKNGKTERGAIFEEKISGPGEFVTFMRHSCRPNYIYVLLYIQIRVMTWAREKNAT